MSVKPKKPARKDKFAQLQVVTPCSSSWEQMSGSTQNGRKRFCADCDKHVFDFAQMTARQVEAVVEAHQGNLCARLTRLPDGSLLTLEMPPVQISNRRTSPILNATVAAFLGISVPATALPATPLNAIIASTSSAMTSDREAGKRKQPKPVGNGDASLGGSAHDPQGNALPNIAVKLVSSLGEERETETSAEGEFLFARIPAGSYLLILQAQGFTTHLSNNITVEAATKQRIDVPMQLDQRMMVAGGIGAGPPQTLLDLYRNSDLIAVAEAGPSQPVEQDGESRLLKTTLRIASVLKGNQGTNSVSLYHWTYDDIGVQFKPGERRLVFLSRRESDDGKPLPGFELSDWGRSIRQMDQAGQEIYQQRLQELARMLERPDSSPVELADWLVRLAEHPLTRWDGVFHLLESSWTAERNKEAGESSTKVATEAEAANEQEQVEEETVSAEEQAEAQASEDEYEKLRAQREQEAVKLIKALTPEHKNRLVALLLNIQTIEEADLDLARLVFLLGDERLTPYLVAQLQKISNEAPGVAESLTALLAESIRDEDLAQVASEYSHSAQYGDGNDEERPISRRRLNREPPPSPALATIRRSLQLKKFLTLVEYKLNR